MKYEFMGFDDATIARFWSKVDKRGPNDCWEWQACLNSGYGYFRVGGRKDGRAFLAHRFAKQLIEPQPLDKPHALHQCDNPKCVNPSHVRWGTNLENIRERQQRNTKYTEELKRRAAARGRMNKKLVPSQIDYAKRLLCHYTQATVAKWYSVSTPTLMAAVRNRGCYSTPR